MSKAIRNEKGHFLKGTAAGPGRPAGSRGMAAKIMAATREGAEMVEWVLGIWRDVKLPFKDRWVALEWLADRGVGKAQQTIDLVGEIDLGPIDDIDLGKLSDEALSALMTALSGMLTEGPTDTEPEPDPDGSAPSN